MSAASARPQYNYNPALGTSTPGAPSSFSSGTLVQKHVYVYEAPNEQEEFRPQRHPISVGPNRKNYKIIFIKAPSSPSAPTVSIIPQQAQNEEKTIIYVLVKRPEEAPEITIPIAAPVRPSKPEVYFIPYKTPSQIVGGGVPPQIFTDAAMYQGGGGTVDDRSGISSACVASLQQGCL